MIFTADLNKMNFNAEKDYEVFFLLKQGYYNNG